MPMKRILSIIILCILLLAGQVWGATVYAKPGAVGYAQYKSGASSCDDASGWTDNSDLQTALTASGSSGVLKVCPGTYAGTMINSTGAFAVAANSQTIQAVGSVTFDFSTASATNIFNAGYNSLTIKGDSATVPLVMIGDTAHALLLGNFSLLQDIDFQAVNGGLSLGTTTGACVVTRCKIANVGGTAYSLALSGSSVIAWTLNNVQLMYANNQVPAIGISNTGTGSTVTINHLTAVGNMAQTIRVGTTSKVALTINNSVFAGNQGGYTIENLSTAGGTCTINNMLGQGNALSQDNYSFKGCTINNSVQNKSPRFTHNKYPSAVAFVVDDLGNLGWFTNTVVPKLEAKGWRGVFSQSVHATTEGNWATLRALEAAGHEIACHSQNHFQLGSLSAPFTIARTGQTASLASGVLATSTPHTYTLASYTLETLRTQMSADGYTVGPLATNYGNVPATALADFTTASINSTYSLAMDTTRTFEAEVATPKATMEANGLHPQTFVPPGNSTSATLRNYLRDHSGFIGARGGGTAGPSLSSYDIYDVGYRDLVVHFTDTDACEGDGETRANCIKRNVTAYLERLGVSGTLVAFYTHGESDWNAADWDALLDAVEQSGILVLTLSQLVNYAKTYDPSGDLTTADNEVYTRTMVDQADYTLRADSPCINAGTQITGIHDQETAATDYAGTSITTLPDIGAYEYADQNLYFDANASAGGNGTKEYPYHQFADYPSWSGYAVRAGSNIYASGTFATGVDLSSLTSLPTTTGCKKNKTCSFPLTGTAVPVHGFRGQSMMCMP